jgi:transcriptional regulator with XRE-family HTH domain
MSRKRNKKVSALGYRLGFALRLRVARLGVSGAPSAKAFAAMLGLEAEAYRRYERAETEPSLATLARIADVTGCTTDFLIRGKMSSSSDESASAAVDPAPRRVARGSRR